MIKKCRNGNYKHGHDEDTPEANGCTNDSPKEGYWVEFTVAHTTKSDDYVPHAVIEVSKVHSRGMAHWTLKYPEKICKDGDRDHESHKYHPVRS